MKTKLTYLLGGLVAIATVLPASAQNNAETPELLGVERVLPGQKRVAPQTGGEKKFFPMLRGVMPDVSISPLLSRPLTVLRQTPKAGGRLESNSKLEIWGNVVAENMQGIYSFSPVRPVSFNQLTDYNKNFFNAGTGLVDGELHGVYLDTQYEPMGFVLTYHYAFDVETWQMTVVPKPTQDATVAAAETATDPTTGEVFGEFYNANLTALEWGVIDYKTMKRTTIATAQHTFVALGITNDGRAYGVADDGNLYQIDRTTGQETLVGSTGIQVKSDEGKYVYQSGEIDPRTNVFYWASNNSEGQSCLYTVDLNDGHVTEVSPLEKTIVLGMTIPAPKAADNAPDVVKNVKLSFDKEKKFGSISFEAPTKTFGGENLTGQLKYTIMANNQEIAKNKTINPGGKTNVSAMVNSDGLYVFTITTSNDAGQSPKVKVKKYIGYDTPKPAKNISFNINETTRKSTVTWEAPTEGVNGGYVTNLRYDVYRISLADTVKVQSGTPLERFVDNIPEAPLTSYRYGIVAINSGHRSAMATSKGKTFGDGFEVPYYDKFENQRNAAIYKVIDNNGDGATWRWGSNIQQGKTFRYNFSKDNAADDWLISPPIKLKAGKIYNVSFKACQAEGKYAEKLEVKWGKAATVEGMTENLLAPTTMESSTFKEFEEQIAPTEDGDYYIGFHAVSPPDQFMLHLGYFSVEAAADTQAPAAVSDLKATAEPTGLLKTTITFKAPTTTMGGAALASISKIDVFNGKRLVKSIASPALGSEQLVNDDAATQGVNTYNIIAYNEFENGEKATINVYVGLDKPKAPKATAYDNVTTVKIDWDDVEGVNGGVVDKEHIVYDIFNVNRNGTLGQKLVSLTGTTEYTVTGVKTDEGPQTYMQWVLTAENKAGKSRYGMAEILAGAPYTLPYHNGMKGGTLEDKFIGVEGPSLKATWNLDTKNCSDGDNGSLIFKPTAPGEATVIMGKFSLKGASKPKVIFDYYATNAAKGKLEVLFERKDKTMTGVLWSHSFVDEANPAEWRTAMVDIPAELLNEEFVKLRFRATAEEAFADSPFYIDNINVCDPYQKDAAIAVEAPESAKKGQTVKLNVSIINNGLDDVENAKLKVSANDKVIHEQAIDQTVKCFRRANVIVDCPTSIIDNSANMQIKAEIIFDGDLDLDNNSANATVALEKANVTQPRDLKTTGGNHSAVTLAWTAPVMMAEEITDDFEAYEAWETDFGPWTTIDCDNGRASSISQQAQYKHLGERFAFINWQPSDLFGAGQNIDPHSGKRAAVAIYQVDKSGKNFVNSDNWLISPKLSGKKQTISFWVNNRNGKNFGEERFDVLASSTDTTLVSFRKIGETHVQNSGQWTDVQVELPEGTNYFAIHHISSADQAFMFTIDDATFEVSNSPVSYNIYRDNKLIGNTAELTYIDPSPLADGQHSYSVTAVYADGSESEPAVANVTTDLTAIPADANGQYTIYTIDGALVLSNVSRLGSLRPGVYVVNGRKVIVR